MIDARYGHTATLLSDGTVLVTGGYSSNGPLASAGLYDPSSGTWTAIGNMDGVRAEHTATLLSDGTVLVAGGIRPSGYLSNPLTAAELYDPSSGTWTATGEMIEAREGHTATLLSDGTVLVAGGNGGALASAELYDPSGGTWTATGSMAGGRWKHTATLLPDGKVLVVGSSPLASAELYNPSSGSWTATGGMIEARVDHTATLLSDGAVLVTGGVGYSSGSSNTLASAELYDPSSGAWTATGNMIEASYFHTATLLPDGKVLVAGGYDSIGDGFAVLASAELYDPSSRSWTATGTMDEGRVRHSATLLPDGRVLVAGGGGFSGPLAPAELYDPGSGS